MCTVSADRCGEPEGVGIVGIVGDWWDSVTPGEIGGKQMRIRSVLVPLVLMALLAAACGDTAPAPSGEAGSTGGGSTTVTIDMASLAPGTLDSWRNNTGLETKSDEVWAQRLATACSEGVWKPDVARRLAEEYAAEDGATPEQLADVSYLESAASGLWLVAVGACRDRFPADALAAGPNFNFSS